jgi:hypothetical protein
MSEWVKANWDVGLDKKNKNRWVWMDIVVRDSKGYVLVARCFTRLGIHELIIAEMLGALPSTQPVFVKK